MRIPDYQVTQFGGLNTAITDTRALKKGVSPSSLNWITGKFSDSISLRGGYALLGTTRQTGTGKVTGLGVGTRYDGVQVPFFSHGRKVKYYNSSTLDTVEIDTDILPAGADGEDLWFVPYQNLGGSFIYYGSPSSSIYKTPVANPGSKVDQSVVDYRFGMAKISQGSMFAGQRKGTTAGNYDKTAVYRSYIDKALLSSYTQTPGEAYGTGDGTTKTFAHTLTVVTGKKTAMYVSVTDTVETFIDDRNGNLIGTLGGTGTVNYATGAVSVTFNTAPAGAQAITCSYYTEDSTSAGILDFSGSTFGQGAVYRQDDGGGSLMAIWPINNVEYCMHLMKTWQLTTALSSTDTSTNLPYRNVGIPYIRAAWQTPDGIIMIDNARPTQPKFRQLQIAPNTTNLTIEPFSISDALDLTGHAFDYAVAFRWGDYDMFCVQEKVNGTANTFNSVMYIRNVYSKAWDKLDFYASCLAEYAGTLIAGDSISDNVFTLFSGYDDDGSLITNHWQDGDMNLGTENLKVVNRQNIQGLIQKDQNIEVWHSYDGGGFVLIYTIQGDGSYVDHSTNALIGSDTIGSGIIGGGGAVTAHPFEIDIPVHSGKISTVSTKFIATGIGAVQINEYTYKDIRDKGRKSLASKTV